MEKSIETIRKINDCYVSDNCIQTIIPYRKSITILDKNNIKYHYSSNSKNNVNSYLEDERRKQFPYSNIPIYYGMKGLTKYTYINQLFDYEKPYIIITKGSITQTIVLKDNNQALLVDKVLSGTKYIKTLNRQELLNMFRPTPNTYEKIWILNKNGAIYENWNIPSETVIQTTLKNRISNQLNTYIDTAEVNLSLYHLDKTTLNYFKNCVAEFDINKISDFPIFDNSVLVAKVDGVNIEINDINIIFMGVDKYKVEITNYPLSEYTLEHVKSLVSKIKESKEYKINFMINSEIKKDDIAKIQKSLKIR